MKDQSMRIAVWLIAGLLICYAIYFARTLIAPIVVAVLFYLTLRPIVCRLERHRVPPITSALMLLILFLATLAISIATVIDPARGWLASLPAHMATLGNKVENFYTPFDAIEDASEQVESMATSEEEEEAPVSVQVQQPQWTNQWYLVNGTSAFVGFVLLTVVLLFFLLATGDRLINSLLHVLPTFGDRRRAVKLILELQGGISSYLGQVTLINAGLGVAVAIAMALIGMPSPLLWGTMAMLLNFIPFLGALAGAAVIFIAAAITFEPLSWAAITTAVYLSLTTIEGNFVTPSLLGKTMQLSPVMVLLSLAFWGWMWGLVGIFVAVPLLIVVRLSFEHFHHTRSLAILLGAEESLMESPQEKSPSPEEDASDESPDEDSSSEEAVQVA